MALLKGVVGSSSGGGEQLSYSQHSGLGYIWYIGFRV